MHRQLVLTALVLLLVGACARAYAPPGGERDTQAPLLVETAPAPLAVVEPFDGPVVFRFNDRLSERQFSEALIVVSPLDGALRVRRTGREVQVRIDGGWRPDRVYRIVLLPGVRDLFGNIRQESAEIVFSTGPEITATAIAGIVTDRITGRPVETGIVTAVRRGDGVEYMAVTDTAGFYSLRHLPLGEYDMLAWFDQNRNRRRDAAEPVDSGHVARLATAADTTAVVFDVMPVDTTPPRVVRAEAVDSLHVRVAFDDYFDVDVPPTATAEVHRMPDSTRVAGYRSIVHAPVFERERAAARAARADTAIADDTVAALPRRQQAPAAAAPPSGRLLPSRDVVVILDRPLPPGTYTVTVGGALNISGLTGGGVARFEVAPPPPPPPPPPPQAPAETVPVDTLRLDTLRVDTLRLDTLRVDTLRLDTPRVDTARVDTARVDTVPRAASPRSLRPGAR
jgi:hypothetical protein